MPIHVPGKRDRRNRTMASTKRSAVAVLQLTAMVDMFTVLAVFLLQNYATTNQILYLPEKVTLPEATAVKELNPSNVVIVADEGVFLNEKPIASYLTVREQEDWMIQKLREEVQVLIRDGEEEKRQLGNKIKEAVQLARAGEKKNEEEIDMFRKITIQADKGVDFLSVKKVMYTVTEAGIYEINFAVLKKEEEETVN